MQLESTGSHGCRPIIIGKLDTERGIGEVKVRSSQGCIVRTRCACFALLGRPRELILSRTVYALEEQVRLNFHNSP